MGHSRFYVSCQPSDHVEAKTNSSPQRRTQRARDPPRKRKVSFRLAIYEIHKHGSTSEPTEHGMKKYHQTHAKTQVVGTPSSDFAVGGDGWETKSGKKGTSASLPIGKSFNKQFHTQKKAAAFPAFLTSSNENQVMTPSCSTRHRLQKPLKYHLFLQSLVHFSFGMIGDSSGRTC